MRFLRKDLAHAALWILLVAVAPRNKVDMRMVNRLTRALTAIHSNIKAADAGVALPDTGSCPVQQAGSRFDFGGIHIEISRGVPPRNYQAMPFADGIVIRQRQAQLVFVNHFKLVGGQITGSRQGFPAGSSLFEQISCDS